MRKAVLLINVGTPDAPTTEAVGSYLREFLNDPYVIEMPAIFRRLLVNGIIVPFRASKSAARYQKLWTAKGSPLLVHLNRLKNKLQISVGDELSVFAAMSYGQPNLADVIKKIEEQNIDQLTVVPLYPHYSRATTLSAIESVKKLTSDWRKTSINYFTSFYQHPSFIKATCKQISAYTIEEYEHVLFSYHSLPMKQIKASHDSEDKSRHYDLACFETTKLLAKALNLKKNSYSTAFQSRFSKKWLGPYTNEVLEELTLAGKKKVLVVTPSFVADCLETTVEIGQEYHDFFISKGGEKMDLVPCLNDSADWVEGLKTMLFEL